MQRYNPNKVDAKYLTWSGIPFDDPFVYNSSSPTRIDSKYFLKPVQDEILNLIDVTYSGSQNVVNLTDDQIVSGIKTFHRIKGNGNPIDDNDLATKGYVDSSSGGGSGTISGSGTIGTITKFTATDTIGDSVIMENAGLIDIKSGKVIVNDQGLGINVTPVNPFEVAKEAGAGTTALEASFTTYRPAANPTELHLQLARGTQSSPDNIQQNDSVGSLRLDGYANGSFFAVGEIIGQARNFTGSGTNTSWDGRIQLRAGNLVSGSASGQNNLFMGEMDKNNKPKLGFYNAAPVAKPTVTGSRSGNAALQSILTGLESQGLIVDSTTAGSAGGGASQITFIAIDNIPPSTSFATLDTRNDNPVLDFDDSTTEAAIFGGAWPFSSDVTVTLAWTATTATTGNVKWQVSFERQDATNDIDADSFATAKTITATTNATSGKPTYSSITFTTSEIDGIVQDDSYRIKIERVGGDAADTMVGDSELLRVEIK